MPITVLVPEGLLSPDAERRIVVALTDSILDINGVAGNPLARRHLIAAVHTIPPDRLYAAGEREPFVNVALRVPTFSLSTLERRRAFVSRMTDIIDSETGDKLPRDRIYVNMIYGDGFWGIGGMTYTDADLQGALAAATA